MATQETKNDAKKAGGYLKEKFTIGITRINNDEVTRAIMKVTSHKLKTPNEKHVVRLISASHGNMCEESYKKHSNINEYIISELEKRSHAHNWIVVLKCMVVFHRLMHDGSADMNAVIQKNRNIFCLRHFKDVADTPDGAAQKYFLESYIRYLEERNYAHRHIGVHSRLESPEFAEMVKTLELPQLVTIFEALELQLEALVEIEYREVAVDNFCTLEAYRKVILDGRRLHSILYDRARVIVDLFDDLPLSEKKVWYPLYEKYHYALEKLTKLFTSLASANRHFGEDVPAIRALPVTILQHLRDELKYSSIPKEDISKVLPTAAAREARTLVGGPKGLASPPGGAGLQQGATTVQQSSGNGSSVGHALVAKEMPDIFGDDDNEEDKHKPSHYHHHHHGGGGSGLSFNPTAASSGPSSIIATPTTNAAPTTQSLDLFGQWGSGADSDSSSVVTGSPSTTSPTPAIAPRFETPPVGGAGSAVSPNPHLHTTTFTSSPMPHQTTTAKQGDAFQDFFGNTGGSPTQAQQSQQKPAEFDPFADAPPPKEETQTSGPIDFFSNPSRRSSHGAPSPPAASRAAGGGYSTDGRQKAW